MRHKGVAIEFSVNSMVGVSGWVCSVSAVTYLQICRDLTIIYSVVWVSVFGVRSCVIAVVVVRRRSFTKSVCRRRSSSFVH